ncbi:MAG: 2,4-dihydroxyhept-2-ene-1,7-dioic acid aldolase [Thalassobium sp.]|nr:MAG: 2,4-dihydroxyhept-2-ene-1,7-dioic acid aldolase [Thalassobium sp.]
MNAQTTFRTEQAKRYLGTLCKHFSHKVPVELDGNSGRIELPFGQCELDASGDGLNMKVSAETKADLDKTAQVIASHLERFAFRENPQIEWH